MSRRFLLLVVVLLLAGAGLWAWLQRPGGERPPDVPTSGPDSSREPVEPTGPATRAAVSHTGDSTPALVAYVVRDASTGEPLAGVELRAARDGKPVATTDASGRASVPGREVFHFVFLREGYLVGFYPLGTPALAALEAGRSRNGRYEIALEPDRYTVAFAMQFVTSQGAPAQRVRFRLEPLDVPPPSGGSVPRNHLGPDAPIEPALAQAWRQHADVTALPAFQKLPHHFGIDSAQTLYECNGSISLRCVATGPYRLEAHGDGEVVRQQVFVQLHQERPLVVRFEPARTLRGTTVDAERGTPIEGVEVSVRTGGLGPAPATSDAAGAFQLAPLSGAPVTVHALRRGYAELVLEGVTAGAEPVRLALRPHARRELRGRVRSRAGLQPLAGAEVVARFGGEVDGKATAGPDGRFVIATTLEEPEVVARADGHLEWVEVVTPGGPALDFDLIPAKADARVAAGLSALISGRVVGPDGQPRAGVPVMVHSEQAPPLTGIAGRRVISGLLLPGEPTRIADAEGRFVLECTQPGPARLVVVDGVSTPEQARVVQVQLGTHLRDLELRAQK